jgi:hypothetical protein
MLALYRSGRPAEALAVYQDFRTRLADELGLDPSPALQDLERRILRHDPALAPSSRAAAAPATAVGSYGPADAPTGAAVVGDGPFVGREVELARLAATARSVSATGLQVVLVTGEAGVGKTRLLTQFGAALASEGWLVAVGRCPEHEGAPPAWAWVEALRWLADPAPPGHLARQLAPLLTADPSPEPHGDASAGRFLLRRAVCTWLGTVARSTRLALVLDDLHAADAETLALLVSMADQLADAPLLVVAAYRPADAEAGCGTRLPAWPGVRSSGCP